MLCFILPHLIQSVIAKTQMKCRAVHMKTPAMILFNELGASEKYVFAKKAFLICLNLYSFIAFVATELTSKSITPNQKTNYCLCHLFIELDLFKPRVSEETPL